VAAITCPNCGAVCSREHVFCDQCGASLRGTVRRGARHGAPDDGEGAGPPGALIWFLELFPGLLSPLVLICAVGGIAVSAGILWLALLMLGFGALITAFFIGGAGIIVYWASVSWVLYGYVASPTEALAEFESKHWVAFFLLTAIPASTFFYLAKMALAG